MGWRACCLLGLLLAGLLSAGLASAETDDAEVEEPGPKDRTGFFVAVGGAVGIPTELQSYLEVLDFRTGGGRFGFQALDAEPGVGLSVRAGYRPLSWLAAEAQLEWISSFNVLVNKAARLRPAAQSGVGTVEALTVTGNVRAYLTRGRIQPFALLGVGIMHFNSKNTSAPVNDVRPDAPPILTLNISDQDGTAFAARLGGGVDMILTDRTAFVLTASYVLPTGRGYGFQYVSIDAGFQFSF